MYMDFLIQCRSGKSNRKFIALNEYLYVSSDLNHAAIKKLRTLKYVLSANEMPGELGVVVM